MFPGQAPVSLSMYKSSYMADFKDFSNYQIPWKSPEEQIRVESQLRIKEFCTPGVRVPADLLAKGYPTAKDVQVPAQGLGPPVHPDLQVQQPGIYHNLAKGYPAVKDVQGTAQALGPPVYPDLQVQHPCWTESGICHSLAKGYPAVKDVQGTAQGLGPPVHPDLQVQHPCWTESGICHSLAKGYPAVKDVQGTAQGLGPPVHPDLQVQHPCWTEPGIYHSDYNPSSDPKVQEGSQIRYQPKRFPKPIEFKYPLPDLGGYKDQQDPLCPSAEGPVLYRWGPEKPFYG
ncbi:testis-expressed sequence 37 protein [Monodelphis domestica]|uniref:testis-expressed sequence 37 protein n=1 Tax=Monodelphis domestica TaxID=13616 RepID=UPI0024E19AC4|nr:testis-expressed sequence 37 protein [Monodelphis domestica]XP_056669068.1 testis-expressed sequence 37 protein [Monodelphis domestica]